jgi:SET domain-containing protein
MKKYPKESWINPKVEIRVSKLDKKGMFAKEPIRKDEVVVIWGAKYVGKRAAEKARKTGKLIMQLDDDLFSVEERGEDATYFMNHSCNPNVWMKDAITLQAKRNIRRGEELTADYAMWEGNENFIAKWKCACGSRYCRKIVTGRDWKIPKLQKRYKGHFSPLINKRIRATKT